mmetsp:Transcript_11945/g.30303  ORF Transcript_11945/g.30303 Transcript_11945/m.30303 type:complete len:1001 (-) Transcript_11945:264-3266(-)|eukprot:CAMPEP_0116084404 /NCGR_PEP_ID=MMETSP0327-20121206/3785_1 /TAXON_ID=44447 /ORGANISM="Pseudo-nitzschia delicatissima, Strain B596" /LENGTH=1000 /DNA_ID=CAMNT_0003575349 /DNA_START=287 /DNA_END=3292 /DNA_ORIENTATION=-
MSFDFNLSSSDDDDSDKEEGGSLFGGVVKEDNDAIAGGISTKSTKVTTALSLSADIAVEDSDAESHNQDDGDFGFDGYDDYYDFEDDDRKPSSLHSSSTQAMAFPSDFDVAPEEQNHDDDDDEDEDEIDWEDAEEETEEEAKTTSTTPKAVTLDLGKDTNDSTEAKSKQKSTKRARSVSVFRHNKLEGNPGLQSLLGDLHKASLLAWASHAYGVSADASNETNLGLAHSLIPIAWLWKGDADLASTSSSFVAIPTEEDVGHFVHWFTTYVGSSASSSHNHDGNVSISTRTSYARTGKRIRSNTGRSANNQNGRQRAAPSKKKKTCSAPFDNAFSSYRLAEYCTHLADIHREITPAENENHFSFRDSFRDSETLLLFLSMVRSLGWRARYLVALEPISRDLDMNHPLFHNHSETGTTLASVSKNSSVLAKFFGNVLSWSNGNKETPIVIEEEEDSKPAAKETFSKNTAEKLPASLYSNSSTNDNANMRHYQHVCWAEVLCKTKPKRVRSQAAATAKSQSLAMQWMHVDSISGITNQPNMVEEAIFDRAKERINNGNKSKRKSIRNNGSRNKLPISYALAVEHLQHSGDTETPEVRMIDVTRRYASSMVATMEARGIALQKASSKPKRRKTKRAMMMGVGDYSRRKEERPDEWFSKFLDVMSKRHRSSRKRKNPSRPPKATQEELKSRGGSKEDAIALDDDDNDSDLDKKPPALNKLPIDNDSIANIDHEEEFQLKESAEREPLPTSKAAFKKHPLYVISSVLNSTEVLHPNAKSHVCGMFKGELVFRRQDVETAVSAKRWLYEGRKVKDNELRKPILKVKARKKPSGNGFKALKSYGVGASNDGTETAREQQIREASEPLNDGTESLYGSWQTLPWGPPPVGPSDPIPVNEHKNIELELLNPGLVHVELYRVATVAKKLGLAYAPCLLGFERKGKPTIRGIVVHETSEELLREAHAAMHDHLLQEENEKREKAILLRWKRILVGVLTKDRLEREYGDQEDE